MKKNGIKISVVIVTKNRVKDLQECIGSLLAQSKKLDELIVIDNNSTDQTKKLINNLKNNCNLAIRYYLEKKTGYPIVYNRGLIEASSHWVVFIDDDCIANSYWYSAITEAIKKNQSAAAIMGKSNTYYSNNVYSLATLFFNQMWKENGKTGETITDFSILDNKNIVYNNKFLKQHALQFDESLINITNGVAEDIDLGLRIKMQKGKAVFDEFIKIQHKDPVSFQQYFVKLTNANRAAQMVIKEDFSQGQRRYRFRNWFSAFCIEQKVKGFLKFRLRLLILLTILWQKSPFFL